jgi:hypothetical protein
MTHLKPPYRDEADFGGFCHWDMNETQLREGLKLATQVKFTGLIQTLGQL